MVAALGLETARRPGDSGAPGGLKGDSERPSLLSPTPVVRESKRPMSAEARRCLTIVLAAGEGMRMRSARPKVLHELAGRSMLAHVLSTVREGAPAT